ncbi:MAG: MarR family transcriptional regulator [Hyphomicrobiaceae bacterium]
MGGVPAEPPRRTPALPKGPSHGSRAQRTLDRIDRLARIVRLPRHQGEMSPAQWEALSYLARANLPSRTPGALALYLGATKGTVSQTVIALERRGLIEKTENPTDRRSVRLDLTTAGRELLSEAPIEPLARALQSLTSEQRRGIEHALDLVLRVMVTEGAARPFGRCRDCRHFSDAADPGAAEPFQCRLLAIPLSQADGELICAEQQPGGGDRR